MSKITYTKEELRKDYSEACDRRKELSIKYGANAKSKDIQEKILCHLKEIRAAQSSWDMSDLTDWVRQEPKVTKLAQYLDGEPLGFLKLVSDGYLTNAKKGGMSIAGKYARSMYEKINAYIREAEKPIEQKINESINEDSIKKLVEKLEKEMAVFKEKLLENAEKFAIEYYKKIPAEIKMLTKKHDDAYNEFREKKLSYWSREYAAICKLSNKIGRLRAVITRWPSIESFADYTLKETESKFRHDVLAIANRLVGKGFNTEMIKLSDIKSDPKFFDMIITDGTNKLHCRSILAAMCSTKVTPHYRFIFT